MHTFGYMLSKPPVFPPYHFPLLFFPFLHSLTCLYLLCFSSGQRPPSAKTKTKRRKRRRRGSNKGAWAGRGGQNRLIWHDTSHVHTHRGHCSAPLRQRPLWSASWACGPLSFLLLLSSPPQLFSCPLVFLHQPTGDFHPPRGRWLRGLDFPWQAVCSNEQWPASGCLRVLAKYESRRSQTPVKNREVWRKGKRCAHIWATWWNHETLPRTLAKQKYREMMCKHEPLQLFNPGVYIGWALRRWPSRWPHCCMCAAKIPH